LDLAERGGKMTVPRSGRSPSPLLPLGYLTTAAVAFPAAALGLVWLAPALARHYYHPHLLALPPPLPPRWLPLAIVGASYQLIPIVLERPIWSERLARWELGVLVVGIVGMIAHFYIATWAGLVSAAALVAVGVAIHLVNVTLSLRGSPRWNFT